MSPAPFITSNIERLPPTTFISSNITIITTIFEIVDKVLLLLQHCHHWFFAEFTKVGIGQRRTQQHGQHTVIFGCFERQGRSAGPTHGCGRQPMERQQIPVALCCFTRSRFLHQGNILISSWSWCFLVVGRGADTGTVSEEGSEGVCECKDRWHIRHCTPLCHKCWLRYRIIYFLFGLRFYLWWQNQILINHQADVEAQNASCETPLLTHAKKGNLECVLLLLDKAVKKDRILCKHRCCR